MNTTLAEASILAGGVKEGVADLEGVEVVLCPPFPWLTAVAEILTYHPLRHLTLGAQNIHYKESGAYTGEVAASMIKGLVRYVILGHSERRRYFHETDKEINQKVKMALAASIRPIICVGELRKPEPSLLAQPDELTAAHLRATLDEISEVLFGISQSDLDQVVIAYEPVWAISSNTGATPATGLYANAVIAAIKTHLKTKIGSSADAIPVLYGGSVNAENAVEFIHQDMIHGFLVGGASLKVQSFVKICQEAHGFSV